MTMFRSSINNSPPALLAPCRLVAVLNFTSSNVLGHCARKTRTRPCRTAHITASSKQSLAPPTQFPDVDRDLWEVLELATDEELDALHATLHRPSLLSPLVKNLVASQEPASVAISGRTALMLQIEQRFRFLAVCAAGSSNIRHLVTGRRCHGAAGPAPKLPRCPAHASGAARRQVRGLAADRRPGNRGLPSRCPGVVEVRAHACVTIHTHQRHVDLVEGLDADTATAASYVVRGDGMAGIRYECTLQWDSGQCCWQCLHPALLTPLLREAAAEGKHPRGVFASLNAPLKLGGSDLLQAAAKLLSATTASKVGAESTGCIDQNASCTHLRQAWAR